jgi:polar amino acid transport system substrate-binding protein
VKKPCNFQSLGKRLRPIAWLLCMVAAMDRTAAEPLAPLKACASHTPPFVLFAQTEPVGGFSFELLQSLSRQMGRKLQVGILPWARCLQYVKSGSVDLAIDAYDDAERHKYFFYSTAYHTLTPQIFYKAGSLFDSLQISAVRDLDRFRGCGVHDYTYEHYDLDATALDLGAADDAKMLLKLKAGHCDYAVEELEYILGGRSHNANWPDESGLKSMRPSWARGPRLHFLIGKSHPRGKELLAEFDQAIALAEKSGQTGALRKRYFGGGDKAAKKL